MTTSPTFTSSGTRLPLSSTRPGPTAMTVPSWGFSLAVSGMTRPEAVVVSASLAWTTTRSSSGLMLTLVAVVTTWRPLRDRTAGGCADAVARDAGACRRGGQAPVPVSVWHSTHESASHSTGIPRSGGRPVGDAVPVTSPDTTADEDRAVVALRRLRTAEGAAAAVRAAALLAEGADLLAGLSRLRAEVGPELAGPAWELARLRARARPVFGADADVLLLTADTLEQAGRPRLADRRAARLLAAGPGPVADLGCGAGTDSIALARRGASVVAIDPDPVARELTAANAAALGVAPRVQVVAADVVDVVDRAELGGVAGCPAAVLDPARRAGGRRQ